MFKLEPGMRVTNPSKEARASIEQTAESVGLTVQRNIGSLPDIYFNDFGKPHINGCGCDHQDGHLTNDKDRVCVGSGVVKTITVQQFISGLKNLAVVKESPKETKLTPTAESPELEEKFNHVKKLLESLL